ncbi:islet amyloid polypeptide-like [Protobothrops mucrosquamatus]|uniref:islet amyloid polypeptide-like n=1 Tax=Protobothrops mucrosquamatus TaxID=103944 RepID=UPI0010FB1060|nr:islet amyloid polypeptide-like [Protobothrops mucrosquamatus]
MCSLKGPFIFVILSLTLNSLEATPVKRLLSLALSYGTSNRQLYPCHHLEKRKCNTATCVTQRLADFLVRSSNTIGTIYSPTNVGANTYGKRGREVPNYLQL